MPSPVPAEAEILLAAGDRAARSVVAAMLRGAGFDVREAGDGAEALEEARRRQPDLAILDVELPAIDGFEACRRIKGHEATGDVPVLLLAAAAPQPDAQVEGLETGADGYLTQPVEAPVLAATVRSLLRARRAEATVRRAALQWHTTFDAISDAVAVVDGGHVVQRANRAFARLFGADAAAVQGRALATICPALHDELRAPADRGELEVEGRTLRVRRDAIAAGAGAGADGGFVVTLTDVTASRRDERERAAALDRERTISTTLQQSLLPERLPRHPKLRLDAWHLAAADELIVGGDWYDVIEVDGGVWLVIGDVAGHGVAAAAQAGQLRHSLRVYAHEGFGLSEAIARLNELVLDVQLTGLATVCIAALDHDTDAMRMIRAGHPPPLLLPRAGAPRLVEGEAGVVLGVPGARCREFALHLDRGDRLVLYTDGLVERPGESLDRGFERLLAASGGAGDLPALRAALVSRMVDVRALRDDVALLLAERR